MHNKPLTILEWTYLKTSHIERNEGKKLNKPNVC